MSEEQAQAGDLGKARAHWVAWDTVAWDIDIETETRFRLHYAPGGGLKLGPKGIEGGEAIELSIDEDGFGDEIQKTPHLKDHLVLNVDPHDSELVPKALKGQLAVSAVDSDGVLLDATGLQIPGVLDDLYTYDGTLGLVWADGLPELRVWAPTARTVTLHLFSDSTSEAESAALPMDHDAHTGVWSIKGDCEWKGRSYLYEVEVYVASTGQVEANLVTDPYSVGLSINSLHSQIIDLSDPDLMPEGWTSLEKPPLSSPEDIVLYELHVRDFSANDPTVPAEKRGTYLAFTEADSAGMRHLSKLAESGLTHIHLLPVFDFATVNEDRDEWQSPDFDELAALPPYSERQQEIVSDLAYKDGYNWGYDPLHYSVPEGSYATRPNGPARTLEFREMVKALNERGLRVVMDVVYNHTYASGQSEMAVLDRIVPGYYHRLDENGRVATSTCCANTATEHNMMRKLMIDSLLMWATAYKVDGFRFDLMGHHMLRDIMAAQEALRNLNPGRDGIDGAGIYIYGEGWDFGEVANNARGINASQLNIGGTGIGTFNDRLRDSVRGGTAFAGPREQGFINGLYDDPNEYETREEAQIKQELLDFADRIRVALAGNLDDYAFVDRRGEKVTGADLGYDGSPTGYTQQPKEHVPYISAHDNETLFDAIQYKASKESSLAERVRMQNLGISLVALSQGVPFFHGGTDMLRSKSFDRDSFDSGDWFNKLDFTYQDNNFGAGLPPARHNERNWPLMRPLLARTELHPKQEDVLNAVTHFREMLRIRKSSPLFRLRTAEDVKARLRFHNTGPDQVPGLIIMSLSDVGLNTVLDSAADLLLVIFNATRGEQRFALDALVGVPLALHSVQQASRDDVVRTARFEPSHGEFAIPARSTVVFVADGGTFCDSPFDDGDQIVCEGPSRRGDDER